MIRHNYLAILVVVLMQFAIGFLWYGVIFGDMWSMAHFGISPEEMQAQMEAAGGMSPMPYILNMIGNILLTIFLSWLVQRLANTTFSQGALTGFYVSLGAVVPTVTTHYAFLQISTTVAIIDIGMTAVIAIISAGVLAVWRKKT